MEVYINTTKAGYCYVMRLVFGDDKTIMQRARNWYALEREAKQVVITKEGGFKPPYPWMACPPELAAKARWPETSIIDTQEEREQLETIANQAGTAYAEAHPLPEWGAYRHMKREAEREADGLADLQRQAAPDTLLPHSFHNVFTSAFDRGCWHAWREQLQSAGNWRDPRIGEVLIVPIKQFGRWRVQVCKVARPQRVIFPEHVKADNWQELEPPASAYLLAKYGTVETGRARCPRSIARRARWTAWEKRQQAEKEGQHRSAGPLVEREV